MSVLIIVCLLSCAIFLIRQAMADPHDIEARAIVSNVSCGSRQVEVKGSGKNPVSTYETLYDCNSHVTYSVDGKKYEKDVSLNSRRTPFTNGEVTEIYYNPTDPNDAIINPPIPEKWLYMGISGLLLVCIGVCGYAYFVYTNDTAATFAGASSAASTIKDFF